jgi:DNA-binding Lrp family transcriptional regulator
MDMYTNRKKRRLAGLIQGSLPLERRPFRFLAERAGLAEEEILSGIGEWKREGIVRKFGAVLTHREAEFGEKRNESCGRFHPDRNGGGARGLCCLSRDELHCYEDTPGLQVLVRPFTPLGNQRRAGRPGRDRFEWPAEPAPRHPGI